MRRHLAALAVGLLLIESSCDSGCPSGSVRHGDVCQRVVPTEVVDTQGAPNSTKSAAASRIAASGTIAAGGGGEGSANGINSSARHAGGASAGTSGVLIADAGGSAASSTSPSAGSGGRSSQWCGNGVIETGETCDGNCPDSCPAQRGCVAFKVSGSGASCDAECVMMNVSTAKPGDGCCPEGANAAADSDCPVSCGDGILQEPETCEPRSAQNPCPDSCDDGDPCTTDKLTGSAAQCNAKCTNSAITGANDADHCCPAGANANADSDCKPKCGNRVVESGELCDGNCPGSCSGTAGCTRQVLMGSASQCSAICMPLTITSRVDGDGCCPDGANANDDRDCPEMCGDGVVSLHETCDGNCPSACVTGSTDPCIIPLVMGSAQTCSLACFRQPVTAYISGDGCCPGGGTKAVDSDCWN